MTEPENTHKNRMLLVEKIVNSMNEEEIRQWVFNDIYGLCHQDYEIFMNYWDEYNDP